MTEDTIRFLGLIRRAGKLEIGDMAVAAAVKSHKAKLVLLTNDAGGGITKKIHQITTECHVPCMSIPLGKDEFSNAIGRDNVAVAAVNDLGFSTSLAEKIASEHPEEPDYRSLAEALGEQKKKRTNRADNRRK